jgi:hypothetical protein
MAVCHVGVTWGVQSLFIDSVYLASRVEGIRHKRMRSTQPTAKDRGCISVFDRIPFWFTRSYFSESDAV